MTTPNTTANISPLPSGDYIFRVAALNSVGQGAYNTLYSAMPVPDPYFGNVSLLMHMDGTGNSFIDSSSYNHTITAVADATQSSTQSKFGGLSAYFDGSGDYLTADSSSFAFGAGDFTIEQWIYPNNIGSNSYGIFQTSSTSGGLQTGYNTGIVSVIGANNVGVGASGHWFVVVNGTFYGSTSSVFTVNAWHHVAITRSSGILRGFVNGILIWTANNNTSINGQNLSIAGYYDSNYLYQGYIDEFRVTKGIARYTSNFTPSPVPFPVSPIITISSQPSNQTTTSDASFSITASVTPGATLSYQWQKKKGSSAFSNISAATSSTLSLSNLTHTDNSGEIYRCVVRSTGGISVISNTATLTVLSADQIPVSYLVIAGGGSGRDSTGGGGGAGGYRSSVLGDQSGGGASAESPLIVSLGNTYNVVVGAGGISGNSGSNSSFHNIVSIGGGGADSIGGSGAGAGNSMSMNIAGTIGQGYAGGAGRAGAGDACSGNAYSAGGGGGAGSVGQDATINKSGNGGNGLVSSIDGLSVTRAGGGGGGADSFRGLDAGSGGSGGGGRGGRSSDCGLSSQSSQTGTTNTGSGGGGGSNGNDIQNSSSGGSGIVILRSPIAAASTTGSPIVTTVGSDTVYTFTSSGSITF